VAQPKYLSIFEYKRVKLILFKELFWKSKIMSVKCKIESGYGTSFLAEKVASIPIGYSHGYSRSLSNQGRVLIKGQQCIVVGSVNMNMMTVDVTNLESVKKDDEVVLIGSQNEISISIAFSDYSNH
jgi:alanine racemase